MIQRHSWFFAILTTFLLHLILLFTPLSLPNKPIRHPKKIKLRLLLSSASSFSSSSLKQRHLPKKRRAPQTLRKKRKRWKKNARKKRRAPKKLRRKWKRRKFIQKKRKKRKLIRKTRRLSQKLQKKKQLVKKRAKISRKISKNQSFSSKNHQNLPKNQSSSPKNHQRVIRKRKPRIGGLAQTKKVKKIKIDWEAYRRLLVTSIERQKHYPRLARRMGLEGTVLLLIEILPNGHLRSSPQILRSSGYRLLDEEALRMVKRAQPFPTLRGIHRPFMPFKVPIRFHLD